MIYSFALLMLNFAIFLAAPAGLPAAAHFEFCSASLAGGSWRFQ
jgi:hypothetical protein